jgi:hypothetical protein
MGSCVRVGMCTTTCARQHFSSTASIAEPRSASARLALSSTPCVTGGHVDLQGLGGPAVLQIRASDRCAYDGAHKRLPAHGHGRWRAQMSRWTSSPASPCGGSRRRSALWYPRPPRAAARLVGRSDRHTRAVALGAVSADSAACAPPTHPALPRRLMRQRLVRAKYNTLIVFRSIIDTKPACTLRGQHAREAIVSKSIRGRAGNELTPSRRQRPSLCKTTWTARIRTVRTHAHASARKGFRSPHRVSHVLERVGREVVRVAIPETAGRHRRALFLHLAQNRLHHALVPWDIKSCVVAEHCMAERAHSAHL